MAAAGVRGGPGGGARPGGSRAERGPAHGVRLQPRLLWDGEARGWRAEGGGEWREGGQALGIMGWRGLLRRGRASRDYYGMARPPATGGGQVGGGEYYGMAGPPAAGGVLWDEDAP